MNKLILMLILPLAIIGCASKGINSSDLPTKIAPNDTEYKINIPTASVLGPNFLLQIEDFNFIKTNLDYTIIAKPLIVDNVIYLLDNKANIIALDFFTQKELWKLSLNYDDNVTSYHSGDMIFHENIIYVTYGDVYLVAVNAKSGYEIFRKKTSSIIEAAPAIYKEKLYLQSMNDAIDSVGSKYGNFIWRTPSGSSQSLINNGSAPIIYKNKWLIVFDCFGKILISDLSDGKRIAEMNPTSSLEDYKERKNNILTQPILDNNAFYLANSNNYLVKFDVEKNALIWSTKILDIQKMTLCGNILFVVTNSCQVLAVSNVTGKVIWSKDLIPSKRSNNKTPAIISAPFLYNNNYIYYHIINTHFYCDIIII
jgi:outer membrane protein assembly factor BamB